MSKILSIPLILTFILLIATNAHAEKTACKKLLRGFSNVTTAVVEVPKQARAYWIEGAQKTDHILIWIGAGTVKGLVETVKRTGSGLWDILTFPVAVPENYESLVKPGCVFDEWPRNPVSGR